MLGATNLSQLCQELELSRLNGSPAVATAIVSQAEIEYEKVKIALLQRRQHLDSMLSSKPLSN
jgi:HPt (histidine-containing phosphotransfer) domain-containing protein